MVTTTAATGSIQTDVLRKDFGLLLAHLMGSTATPVQQAATAAKCLASGGQEWSAYALTRDHPGQVGHLRGEQ